MADSDLKTTLEFIKEHAHRNRAKALMTLLYWNLFLSLIISIVTGLKKLFEELEFLAIFLFFIGIFLFLIAVFIRPIIKFLQLISNNNIPADIKKSLFFIEGLFFGSPQKYFRYAVEYVSSENYEEAAKWLEKAAKREHTEAQFNLGVAYYYGYGVTEDKKEAVKWFKKAAGQGLAGAQSNLGVAYYKGDGIAQDKTKAIKWLTKAAKQGLAPAQYNLGVAYENVEGVTQDKKEAVKWYTKAAEQGHAKAQEALNRINNSS